MTENWIAVYTKSRFEKVVHENLESKGIISYLPLIRKKRRWSDRWKWVDVPMFSSYVFAKIISSHQAYVLETPGVHKIIKFQNKIAIIPEYQIQSIKQIIEGGFDPVATEYFVVGDEVEIIGGPMVNVRGIVARIDGEDKFIVKIDAIQHAVAVHIDRKFLKPLKARKHAII